MLLVGTDMVRTTASDPWENGNASPSPAGVRLIGKWAEPSLLVRVKMLTVYAVMPIIA